MTLRNGHPTSDTEPGQADLASDPEGWLDRHGDALYRYALLRLRDRDLAADLVQETFLEALRARHGFAGRSSERTWLIGILKHKVLDHYRRAGRERAASGDDPLPAPAGPSFDRRGHWRVAPAAWAGDPGRDLEAREFWDAFAGCLSKLPAGIADAFFLREVDGLGAEEVQRLLGITPANFWARLHRARSALRRCLEAGWFGRRPDSPPLRKRSR